MSKIDDGGPAFPCSADQCYPGMSLRDYFAAHASGPDDESSANWVADCLDIPRPALEIKSGTPEAFAWWRNAISQWKYASADAMIAQMRRDAAQGDAHD